MNGNNRSNIVPGLEVLIVLKKDQRSGDLTQGIVKDVLTSSSTHSHGIKVRLTTGEIGRVKEILEEPYI
ncbi:MAG: YwbE family protein [Lentisphaerota bacterium]